jgi:hypothetical protein
MTGCAKQSMALPPRHCERSEAIHVETEQGGRWIASSLALLAMTPGLRLPVIASEAKQSMTPQKDSNGLLRRCAPRNDGVKESRRRNQ